VAIEKMANLSIVGREEVLDRFVAEYLLNSGMQPENAMQTFETGWNLSPYTYDTKAKEQKRKCEDLFEELGIKHIKENDPKGDKLTGTIEKTEEELGRLKDIFDDVHSRIKDVKNKTDELQKLKNLLLPLQGLNFELGEVYSLRFMRFRYGKIKKEAYRELIKKVNLLEAVLLDVSEDEEYIWMIYLTTKKDSPRVDGIFNIMEFERVWITDEAVGTPTGYIAKLSSDIEQQEKKAYMLEEELEEKKEKHKNQLVKIYRNLILYEKIYDVKKYMVHDLKGSFYIVGWIPIKNFKEIGPKLKKESDITYVVKNNNETISTPPTKLRNNFLVKPFENLVEMYGLPRYTEIDPSSFVAITAFLMFGMMFGDVGQGLIIGLIGYILYRKKIFLGQILIGAGLASIIFGFLYGSIFGLEDILPSLVISPMNNINTMLILGVASGGILILIAMIFNIINGIKEHDVERVLFDKNGVAGVIFYLIVLIFVAFMIFLGQQILSIGLLIILLIIPLAIIFFKENIITVVNKRRGYGRTLQGHRNPGIMEKAFEMLETLLSFASNTISFVRLSAFAINHVGLCMAIYILAGMTSGAGHVIVAIIGNALIIALEGLIVGIQVLRLEYYELFSRFYSGDGKEYKPLDE